MRRHDVVATRRSQLNTIAHVGACISLLYDYHGQ